MENVVENVVTETVEVPEVVETVTAIQPVEVPQIEVPVAEQKAFLGLDTKTWKDVAVLGTAVGTGVVLDRAVPWMVKKIKGCVKRAKKAFNAVKENDSAENQAKSEEQKTQTENPVSQTETTPATPQEK